MPTVPPGNRDEHCSPRPRQRTRPRRDSRWNLSGPAQQSPGIIDRLNVVLCSGSSYDSAAHLSVRHCRLRIRNLFAAYYGEKRPHIRKVLPCVSSRQWWPVYCWYWGWSARNAYAIAHRGTRFRRRLWASRTMLRIRV